MKVPFFSSIGDALGTVYSAHTADRRERRRLREQAFATIFEPAFQKLEEIHRNYMSRFHEFVEVCQRMATPHSALVRDFRWYSLEYSHWREELRAFGETAAAMEQKFKHDEEKAVIREFADALSSYFDSAIGEEHYSSWFSDFMSAFESQVRQGRSPWDYDYNRMISSGSDVKLTLINQVRAAYEVHLPERWKRVATARDKLRSVLLSY